MEQVAPAGPVYQAGTLSGNPLAVAAGLATLEALNPDSYRKLEETGARMAAALKAAAGAAGVPITINRVGSMLTAFFTPGPVTDYEAARQADLHRFARWFRRLLGNGILLPPSQFEALFVSTAHDAEAVAHFETRLADSFQALDRE
jgi:glutamate-1-semialdehyde 2,1-aminomutase